MIVRTVLGDIDPGDLGVTYAHEHLIIDSRVVAREWPHIYLPSVDEAVAEASDCAAAGVGTMVDAMPTGSGRDLAKLARVSSKSRVKVVAVSGMHTIKYYEGVPWVDDPPERLAERFIDEIKFGVDGVRTGMLKVATTDVGPSDGERRLFEAAGIAHLETGVAVLTHCENGRGGIEHLDMLEGLGVPSEKIVLSHTDKITDMGYHIEILSRGANVEYDQALRRHLAGSDATASLIAAMWEAGFGAQIMLGTDGARRSLWQTLGGSPGLSWLYGSFPAVLNEKGVTSGDVETMFVHNPARILSIAS